MREPSYPPHAGCANGHALWREIRAKGYGGSPRQVLRWLQQRRDVPAPTTPRSLQGRGSAPRDLRPQALPSARRLSWLCLRPRAQRTAAEDAILVRIAQDPEGARGVDLLARFAAIVRQRCVSHDARPIPRCDAIEAWLEDAAGCAIPAIVTFAAGLRLDGDAVRAALTTPWSNAQTEGQITRLKLVKRQRYGRASFDLLRRLLLCAA